MKTVQENIIKNLKVASEAATSAVKYPKKLKLEFDFSTEGRKSSDAVLKYLEDNNIWYHSTEFDDNIYQTPDPEVVKITFETTDQSKAFVEQWKDKIDLGIKDVKQVTEAKDPRKGKWILSAEYKDESKADRVWYYDTEKQCRAHLKNNPVMLDKDVTPFKSITIFDPEANRVATYE